MKCERCQRNTATQAVPGEKNGTPCELFVCETCARAETKPAPAAALSLADILFSLGGIPSAEERNNTPGAAAGTDVPLARPSAVCPACGLARETLRERRRFGCPACYKAFADDVKTFLRELQYGDRHVGRKPEKTTARDSIAALKTRLDAAVRRENFAKAAELRNVIERHQNDLSQSGDPSDGEA